MVFVVRQSASDGVVGQIGADHGLHRVHAIAGCIDRIEAITKCDDSVWAQGVDGAAGATTSR